MNYLPNTKNKGIAPIIILAIVLALLVVSGATVSVINYTKNKEAVEAQPTTKTTEGTGSVEQTGNETVSQPSADNTGQPAGATSQPTTPPGKKLTITKPANITFTTYNSKDYGFTIKKPTGWLVEVTKDGVIYVKENNSGETETIFTFIRGITDKINAVGLADALIKKTKQTYPDFDFQAKISQNRGIVELNATFTNKFGHKTKGTYLITLEKGNGFFGGYETLINQFDAKKDTLNYILASLSLTPAQASTAGTTDPNLSVPLVKKNLSDNSASISVPQDWTVAGSEVAMLAFSEKDDSGYLGQAVTVYPTALAQYVQAVSSNALISDYVGPRDFIANIYLPKLGDTNVNIIKEDDASQLLSGLNNAEAKILLLTTKSPSGRNMKALILAITMAPSPISGVWYALVYGFWTPTEVFDSKYTLMTRIALSFQANQQYVDKVIEGRLQSYHQGIDNLSKSLTKSYESSVKSGETKAQAEDRLYQKWNDYYAGEERLYSATEDKVYTLPAGYDRYYNPKYSSEQLEPVSNSQYQNEADRSYLPGGWRYGL